MGGWGVLPLTARSDHGDPATRGVIGHATSDNLVTWRGTPFKEFDVTFAPDYAAGEFWSGNTVDYTLAVSGDTVVGTAS